MKTPAIPQRISASIALFALGFAASPTLRAQLPAPGEPGYRPVEVVTPQTQSFAAGQLTGKPVRGANQEVSRGRATMNLTLWSCPNAPAVP